jgi:hypothetical protein
MDNLMAKFFRCGVFTPRMQDSGKGMVKKV